MSNRWLSMHAGYACRHAGACCTSRWPIPLERARVPALRTAVAARSIAAPARWLLPAAGTPGDVAGVLALDARGHCVFHGHDRCEVHHLLGHDALPSACQHFPRVCCIDPRGVSVTLSHYCPTAASLLFDEAPVDIVEGPAPRPGHDVPEGLDARGAWPPLLTPRVLMDHGSYDAWEQHMVSVLAGRAGDMTMPETALARLRHDAARLTRWTPDDGALLEAVRNLDRGDDRPLPDGEPEEAGGIAAGLDRDDEGNHRVLRLFDRVRGAVASDMIWTPAPAAWEAIWAAQVALSWPAWSAVVRRFLAAHAFGSWLAYQGRGLSTIVRGLDAAHAVLRVETARACAARGGPLDRAALHQAIRQADLLLRHHVEPQVLADALRDPE